MSGDNDPVLVHRDGHVVWLTLNRPERANAIDDAAIEALLSLFEATADDDDVRAVAITGTGDRAFCAGRDLKELNEKRARGRPVTGQMAGRLRNVYEALFELPKPTLAVVNGAAVGGGLELALACDLRIASRKARFGTPEAQRGMGANFASVMLPNVIARHFALEMLFTGDPVSADRAYEIGLVNRVCNHDELRREAADLLGRIVVNAPLSLRRFKETAAKSIGQPVSAALRLNVHPNPYASADREEGVRAYVEGRSPLWQGR